MLNTLKTIDPQTAQGILANLTLGMMPNPGVPSSYPNISIDSALREQVVHELRIRLRLKKNDNSPKAQALIYAALADEITRLALSGKNINEVRARVGQQGLLSPNQYKLEFERNFRIAAENYGITRQQAENAIKHPDTFEHFKPELHGFKPSEAISLFLKMEKPTLREDSPYHLLVLTKRHGDVLSVFNAWRIYPSDVDLSNASTPIDVLREFVNVFGKTLLIEKTEKKFFLYEKMDGISKDDKITFDFDPHIKKGENVVGQAFIEASKGGVEIAVGFQIDYDKYSDSLRRHGVKGSFKVGI